MGLQLDLTSGSLSLQLTIRSLLYLNLYLVYASVLVLMTLVKGLVTLVKELVTLVKVLVTMGIGKDYI